MRRLAKATEDCIDQAVADGDSLTDILDKLLNDLIVDLYLHDERIIQLMDRITKLEKRVNELENE